MPCGDWGRSDRRQDKMQISGSDMIRCCRCWFFIILRNYILIHSIDSLRPRRKQAETSCSFFLFIRISSRFLIQPRVFLPSDVVRSLFLFAKKWFCCEGDVRGRKGGMGVLQNMEWGWKKETAGKRSFQRIRTANLLSTLVFKVFISKVPFLCMLATGETTHINLANPISAINLHHHCHSPPHNKFSSLTLFVFFFPAMIHKKQALHTTRGLSIPLIEFCVAFLLHSSYVQLKNGGSSFSPHSRAFHRQTLISMSLSDGIAGCDSAADTFGAI